MVVWLSHKPMARKWIAYFVFYSSTVFFHSPEREQDFNIRLEKKVLRTFCIWTSSGRVPPHGTNRVPIVPPVSLAYRYPKWRSKVSWTFIWGKRSNRKLSGVNETVKHRLNDMTRKYLCFLFVSNEGLWERRNQHLMLDTIFIIFFILCYISLFQ